MIITIQSRFYIMLVFFCFNRLSAFLLNLNSLNVQTPPQFPMQPSFKKFTYYLCQKSTSPPPPTHTHTSLLPSSKMLKCQYSLIQITISTCMLPHPHTPLTMYSPCPSLLPKSSTYPFEILSLISIHLTAFSCPTHNSPPSLHFTPP